ncbi:leucyl aminopeptidase family protein [Amycolatopsis suaedae]|uniref:Probable cytosol aminopeptidase n=1 Tax=Amycolatopsis suaedae TaxID=2510978 RepID=A0A4Q7J6B8_9PSEU|nr:leucyl aminopeptidase family protein [Amycolatopsis suaedae]RZQ62679.1 peptidase M17 [Amycolatopsis suaedae]
MPTVPSVPTPLVELEVSGDNRRALVAELVAPPDGDPVPRYGVRATGAAGEVHTLPAGGAVQWLVGTGSGSSADWRGAGAALVRAANEYIAAESDAGARPARTVAVTLPDDVPAEAVGDFALGLLLGGYRFVVTGEPDKPGCRTIRLGTRPEHAAVVARAAELAAATAFARDLANTPSNIKDPAWLADTAVRVAGAVPGLDVTVRDEQWLTTQGFGGVLAVGGGSVSPPRLIELTYRPRGARHHLLLVGKGITFDTGGLSVKPADGMHLMRTDMSGGAAVIAAMRAIAALGLKVRVSALVPAAENHVSGSAYRPGDVVRHYGGITTEVTNTDAEGRMVMADALAYGVRRLRPDTIVDVATLTGAMKIALGVRTAGLFATDDDLAKRIERAGEQVGEAWWRMPLLDAHADDVRGELADVRQAPGGPGGITAALFLREFTGGLPWAHLDIAGPARADRSYADVVPGGTGFAARTLVELAASYA